MDLEIDLTPGVATAPEVFAWIDTNRDGEISSAEGEAYARQMLSASVEKTKFPRIPLVPSDKAIEGCMPWRLDSEHSKYARTGNF